MAHYETTAQAAARLGLSERQIQKYAKDGRFPGAMMVDSMWLIPDDAVHPKRRNGKAAADGSNESNANGQLSVFDFMKDDTLLNLDAACAFVGISSATGLNWLRAGRMVPTLYEGGKPFFSKDDLRILISSIVLSKEHTLKSRRNKSQIGGNSVYSDYLSDSDSAKEALAVVKQISEIASHYPDADQMIPTLLAEYALRALSDAGRIPKRKNRTSSMLRAYVQGRLGEQFESYRPLIADLLSLDEIANVQSSATNASLLQEVLPLNLPYIPGQDTLGLLYISLKNLRDRKLTGTYYTPMNLVIELVDRQDVLNRDHVTILDPCCGTGNFLLALVAKGHTPDCFYGQDNDPFSVRIARINLALCNEPVYLPDIMSHIVVRDTLLETSACDSYDLIIGNPPWGYNFDKSELALLKGHYLTCDGKKAESFHLFLEYALAHAKDSQSAVSFVLPEAFLNVLSHKPIRNLIIKNGFYPTSVQFRPTGFKNVACPSILLTLSRESSAGQIYIETDDRAFCINTDRQLGISDIWNLKIDDETYEILSHMEQSTPSITLKGCADFALGIVTGNNDKYLSVLPGENQEAVLRGSDIKPFGMAAGSSYITFTPSEFQQTAPEKLYRAPSKLLYRFICSRPVFALDQAGTLTLNSANLLINRIPMLDDHYLLGILNSKAACFYLMNTFHSVKLLRSHIEALPIPRVDEASQKAVISQVQALCEIRSALLDFSEEVAIEQLRKEYEMHEQLLNAKIYHLYGFSEQEAQFVEASISSGIDL